MPPVSGDFLKLLACLSATSIANAISTAAFQVSSFSANSIFCVCLLLSPQTKWSRSASYKEVPKAQCSEHFFKAALTPPHLPPRAVPAYKVKSFGNHDWFRLVVVP